MLETSALAPKWFAQLVCDLGARVYRLNANQHVLFDWLLTSRRTEALEGAFFAETDARAAALYSNAVLVIDWF